MDARAANERIAEKAERLHFVSRVPMLCECSTPSCREVVMIGLEDYHRIRSDPDAFLTAPGHEIEGAVLDAEEPTYAVRRKRADGDGDRRSA
jgi:hypothetical protein